MAMRSVQILNYDLSAFTQNDVLEFCIYNYTQLYSETDKINA